MPDSASQPDLSDLLLEESAKVVRAALHAGAAKDRIGVNPSFAGKPMPDSASQRHF
jgi:hypothetical protein